MKTVRSGAKKSPFLLSLWRWFDADASADHIVHLDAKKVDWFRILPFVIMHLMCLGVIWVGWSRFAVVTAVVLYFIRMFAITGFYHRYFSHKSFKTNRFWQFCFAVLGNASVQRGPLWWAAHHRHHHRYADTEKDIHSPSRHGFIWSHVGWLTSPANFPTKMQYVKDWARFPELRWINRFDTVVPVLLAVALFVGGNLLAIHAPQLGTNGPQLLIWGFFISSVALFHGTVTINSLDHMFGSRRYDTPDTSRNNALLALITLGEGWHNNHHHYAVSARQGFFWWEIDITYYLLKIFSWLGIVWNLRGLPEDLRSQNRKTCGPP
ncbi:MAG: acyl-CoA desaturase [Deltaproteobacteria bacterium]|jgi:stearoyl-CoA desaturase (delta-9 desaturase)|nr:acyl-CoA desaturase [Deltaproteobacteria bacterium]MBW2469389.1 acyl-CoA desaturase [Deltaproteobacteria bacterium]MBW2517852.1 acyl-CoA desaturase [Deltaproteobacteria bacterium]